MINLSTDTYIISDLHFFHGNIIKYCNRPYTVTGNNYFENKAEIDKMNEDILKMFDELPKSCDIYNLGDIFFGGKSNKKYFLENIDILKSIVNRMSNNGNRRLYLVLGNHDDLHFENKNRISFYEELGFNKVYDTPIIIENNNILCHEPVYSNGYFKVIYGHTHDYLVKEDYFTYDYENYAKEKRKNPDASLQIKFPEKIINPDDYINVCYDCNHKFLRLQDIIRK